MRVPFWVRLRPFDAGEPESEWLCEVLLQFQFTERPCFCCVGLGVCMFYSVSAEVSRSQLLCEDPRLSASLQSPSKGSMEPDLDQLKKAWKLTEEEEDVALMPKHVTDNQGTGHQVAVRGSLSVTFQSYHRQTMCHGRVPMDFREEHSHPMQVNLDICDLCVHIHDLPLNMMNQGVATFIGNRTGMFRDLEADDSGRSWGATLRIRVGLNVNQPLKRALKIRSTFVEELLVQFTYERLPNFCFLFGRLGHIDKYCTVRFEEGYRELGEATPYGPWMRAPVPARGISQGLPECRKSTPHSSSQRRSQNSRGAAIFGNFGAEQRGSDVRDQAAGQNMRSNSCNPSARGNNSGEEVESNPSAMNRKDQEQDTSRLHNIEALEVGKLSQVHHQTVLATKTGVSQDVVGNHSKQAEDMEITLFNVPLQFTSQGPTSCGGGGRRGRQTGRGIRGRPRKRSRGIQLIEHEGG
ncbi:UNVERIFIED_CONTAM: hypothetical protein Slati_1483200 [Sesamum latifolium]|uniref:Zinc knuckle CX2CX4HX4C domain-containing protein n=1 Tax=Sesamum latifolium TaxID=2727402 RepID=A0AAW2X5Z6_9LAMI